MVVIAVVVVGCVLRDASGGSLRGAFCLLVVAACKFIFLKVGGV